ncbi:MAG: UxaA family hydrolase [Verrucomicrobia bacterium]|nr:UxaA family hydrolase [Verrucomicrobiota bacterium]
MSSGIEINAYLRPDGRKGIRNILVVAYLVECAHHVAREIAFPFRKQNAHLIGFGGCYPNAYASRMMHQLCTHPNVGAVLLVSLGCESLDRDGLFKTIQDSGRPVHTLVIQQTGGTRKTINQGRQWVRSTLKTLGSTPRAPMKIAELIVGTVCGGSDAMSGFTANPAVGRAFDLLVGRGAAAIFEETNEMIGCEAALSRRGVTDALSRELAASVEKAARYHATLAHGSFAPGNAEGGLTTQEEKSMGSYSKGGRSPISGLIKPGDVPPRGGLYLLDVVPDGEVRFGFPNLSDVAEIGELIACGSHLILFATGRGAVVGAAVSPVIKVCGNPETYRRMRDDMDVNAGRIAEGSATLDDVGREIFDCVIRAAQGRPTASEALGHQEFTLVYKSFDPIGPACLPTTHS